MKNINVSKTDEQGSKDSIRLSFVAINTLFVISLSFLCLEAFNFYSDNELLGFSGSPLLAILLVLFCMKISHSYFYETGVRGTLLSRMQAFMFEAGKDVLKTYMNAIGR